MLGWLQQDFFALLNVIMIDVVLAGDNAIIVGMAASRVAPEIRAKVIFWGIAGAVVLRILFAGITAQLLNVVGLTFAGGLLLLWVCWKMYRQLAGGGHDADAESEATPAAAMTFSQAVTQVVLADVTMSLDNVLAVAGAAKGSLPVLALGLTVAIVLSILWSSTTRGSTTGGEIRSAPGSAKTSGRGTRGSGSMETGSFRRFRSPLEMRKLWCVSLASSSTIVLPAIDAQTRAGHRSNAK